MNISNGLSVFRMILTIPVAYLLYIQDIPSAIILGILAGSTDFFDGYLARKFNQITDLGKILDPLADKFFIGVVGLTLVITDIMPLWFFLSIIIRDLMILIGGLYAKSKIKITLTSTFEGKITYTLILLVTFGLVIDNTYAYSYGIILAVAAMLYTLFQYLFIMVRELRNQKLR